MLLLSSNELQELTSYKYAKYQVRWLRANGIKFVISGDGKPKVLKNYLIETVTQKTKRLASAKPDLSSIL